MTIRRRQRRGSSAAAIQNGVGSVRFGRGPAMYGRVVAGSAGRASAAGALAAAAAASTTSSAARVNNLNTG